MTTLVPGFGIMSDVEIKWWLDLSEEGLKNWHRFFRVIEDLIYSDDPGLKLSSVVDTERERSIQEEDEAEISRLLGLHRTHVSVLDRATVTFGDDQVTVAEQQDLLSVAMLNMTQHESAAPACVWEALKHDSEDEGANLAQWLEDNKRHFVTMDQERAVVARRLLCRKTGATLQDLHANWMQERWDIQHGRANMVDNLFVDRAWQLFEAMGNVSVPVGLDPYERQSTWQYDLAWPCLRDKIIRFPYRLFRFGVSLPNARPFGDIVREVKRLVRQQLDDAEPVASQNNAYLVSCNGLEVGIGSWGTASVHLPKADWKVILANAYPELEALRKSCVRRALSDCVDTEPRGWNARFNAAFHTRLDNLCPNSTHAVNTVVKLLSGTGQRNLPLVKSGPLSWHTEQALRTYVHAYVNPPEVLFWGGVAERVRQTIIKRVNKLVSRRRKQRVGARKAQVQKPSGKRTRCRFAFRKGEKAPAFSTETP